MLPACKPRRRFLPSRFCRKPERFRPSEGISSASGKNRDSIQVSFRDNPETGWISAWLYTESGYGWLIEHGTSHNRQLTKTAVSKRKGKVAADDRTPAHPYLVPAVLQFVAQIAERQREILEEGT